MTLPEPSLNFIWAMLLAFFSAGAAVVWAGVKFLLGQFLGKFKAEQESANKSFSESLQHSNAMLTKAIEGLGDAVKQLDADSRKANDQLWIEVSKLKDKQHAMELELVALKSKS